MALPILNVPISKAGAVAEPSSVIPFSVGTTKTTKWLSGVPVSTCILTGERGIFVVNGYDRPRHVIDTTIYQTGGWAPENAPTVTPTGTQASALLDLDVVGNGASVYAPLEANVDLITIGTGGGGIFVKTVLGTPGVNPQVLAGAGGSDYLDAIMDLFASINEGITWERGTLQSDAPELLRTSMTAVRTSAYQITFTAKDYGTSGNSMFAFLANGTWTDCDFQASGVSGTAIGVANYFENGADGTGSAPEAGAYRYFYTYWRSTDGAETGPSPIATAQQGTAQSIDVDGMVACDDTSFDFVRLYRTEDTGEEFFWVADIPRALSDTPDYNDTTPNGEDDGSLQGYGAIPYDESLYLNYRGYLPPRVRVCALWKNRIWGGGAFPSADYDAGTADVTADSDEVTLSSTTVPTEDMQDNVFVVDGDAETYRILDVAEATRVLTLDRPYQGTTAGTASYTIKDVRDPSQIFCSEPGLPNLWPPQNNPGAVDQDGDDEGITGMAAMDDALLVFSRTSMYRVTGDDPFSWQVHRLPGGVGCSAHNTIQKVRVAGQSGIMWLGPDGIYFYGGGEGVMDLSDNQPDSGISGTIERINLPYAHFSHAYYSHEERVYRCFVPLDNDQVPQSAIVYDLTRRDFTGPDQTTPTTSSANVIGSGGKRVVMGGDRLGGVWQLEIGQSDGGYGTFEPVQDLASTCTVRSLVRKAGTDWPTSGDGLDGRPVLVVYADGSSAYSVVASNTTTALALAYDLDTAPTVDDQVIVGCVDAVWELGRASISDGFENATWRRAVIWHSPESDGEFHLTFAGDQETLGVPDAEENDNVRGDFTETSSRRYFTTSKRAMFGKMACRVVEPGCAAAFLGYGLDISQRDM